MIDPFNIVRYDRTDDELEELFMFAVAVAGKTATATARAVDRFLAARRPGESPFAFVRRVPAVALAGLLRAAGFGCYGQRAAAFAAAANAAALNLRTAQVADLERLPYVGRKTSRFFLLASRPGARVAALDTHLLKHLAAVGVERVPSSTPTTAREYHRLEAEVLRLADAAGVSPAEFDLRIWTAATKSSPPRT